MQSIPFPSLQRTQSYSGETSAYSVGFTIFVQSFYYILIEVTLGSSEKVGIAVHQVKLLLGGWLSHIRMPVLILQFHFWSISLLLHLGRQQKMAPLLGPLPAMWTIWVKFLDLDFVLAQPQPLQPLGE